MSNLKQITESINRIFKLKIYKLSKKDNLNINHLNLKK